MRRWTLVWLLTVVGCGVSSDLSGIWSGELLADDASWADVELDLVDERHKGLGGILSGGDGGAVEFDVRIDGTKTDQGFEVAGIGPAVNEADVAWGFVLTGEHEDEELVGDFECEVGDTGTPDDCLEGAAGTFRLIRQ